jgi:membrane protease YdiL (CAAX protease family)
MSEIQPTPERSLITEIFVSPDKPRLRAGWRLLVQTTALLIFGVCLSIPLVIILLVLDPNLVISIAGIKPEYMLLGVIAEGFAITLSVFLAVRYLDKRPIESLGLKLSTQTLVDILAGIGITFLQMGLIYIALSALGWLTFEGFAWEFDPASIVLKNVLLFFVIFIFVGWNEELLSRGYHLQTIASGINLFWGVIISSAVFGLFHIRNPSATWLSTGGIFFAGIYLAYGYIRTRQLWLSIGLHIGWNFFEGVVFGFPVSGLDIYALTRIQVHGPELWTGGPFGPEAGLIVLPSFLVGAGLIYLYTKNRDHSS